MLEKKNFTITFTNMTWTIDVNRSISVLVKGSILIEKEIYTHQTVFLYRNDNKDWLLESDKFESNIPREYKTQKNISEFLKLLVKPFKSISMGCKKQFDHPGQQYVVEGHFKDIDIQEFSNYREYIQYVHKIEWNDFWEKIQNRVEFDPDLRIEGYTKDRIIVNIKTIKKYYPTSWIQGKVRGLNKSKSSVLNPIKNLNANYNFPSYPLLRVSNGMICVDPSLVLLMTLAEGIRIIESLENGSMILKSILRQGHGILYQILFATYLSESGLISGLEPATGHGNNKHDFELKYGEKKIDLEVKALISKNPKSKIIGEMIKIDKKHTPKELPKPLHVVLILSEFDRVPYFSGRRMKELIESFDEGIFENINKISSLTLIQPFIDAEGIKTKWEVLKIIKNPCVISDIDMTSVFLNNYERIMYPIITDFTIGANDST